MHYSHDNTGSVVNAWTRSAYYSNSSSFCLVNADGTPNNYYSDNSWVLAPGFAA